MPGSEVRTRKTKIDTLLKEAGWEPIVPYSASPPWHLAAIEEYPTLSGPADYALYHHNEPLALIEAKKEAVDPQNALVQVRRYARDFSDGPFDFNGFKVPFVYTSNGEKIWFQDLRQPDSRSRPVARFHTPEALRDLLNRDLSLAARWLRDHPISWTYLRPYQVEAIAAVEQALLHLRGRRELLLAMATGTGKTFIAVDLVYRLIKAGYARRVLFLVDRRALAAQAALAFATYEAEPGLKFDQIYEVYSQQFRRSELEGVRFDPRVLPTAYLTNPGLGQTFVYISTIQRMRINLFGLPEGTHWGGDADDESDASTLQIPIHAFDLVIADECHRGYTAAETGKYREVLAHFDAVKLGITATPTTSTAAYFGEPVYTYSYDNAVGEGWLVDYDPFTIQSQVAARGAFLHEGEAVGLLDRETGRIRYEALEDERELPASELHQDWTAPDHVRKVVKELAGHLRRLETELGRFPKTLIFAENDLQHVSHADRLVNALRDEFGRGDAFVQKITGKIDRPLQQIRQFRNRPEPGIVVTVDMLSTGVDVPAIEVIVFCRLVHSRVLFVQMMGRGTRRCDDLNKSKFTVLDTVGVLSYFSQVTDFTADPPTKSTRQIGEIIEAIANNEDRDYNVRVLIKRLQRIAKNVTGAGRELFKRFIPDGDVAAFARRLPAVLETDWATTMAVLRAPEFLELLDNYPRAQKPFLVAEGVEDYVTSGHLIRTADGRSVKPEDYLAAFQTFIRANADEVEAIRILLDRPAEWRTEVLADLRRKLADQPEGFTVDRLRQAYHHELADIISMIKHAGKGEPLLSAEERVNRAMARVTAGRSFTAEQGRWLDLIRRHLVENLTIDPDDFTLYTFTIAGATWNRVDYDFDNQLQPLLDQINQAIAE